MPKETVVENPETPEVKEPGQGEKTPINAGVTGKVVPAKEDPTKTGETASKPEFDVQKSHDELGKSYKELRGAFTRSTQDASQLRKQIEDMQTGQKQLAEMLSKATEKPIDPEQFMVDFKAQGPKALDSYIESKLNAATKEYKETAEQQTVKSITLEAQVEKFKRIVDNENYPDFAKFEPVMRDIVERENCPIDLQKPIGEVYDALYKLAKDDHSTDAIKAAEELGRRKAEEQLAKESATTIAGGGKTTIGTTAQDMSKMPLDKLENLINQVRGVVDRD